MKIALVTTPWSSRSGIADYTRHLLPHLRTRAEVSVFVEIGREGEECGSEAPRPVSELEPREFDQILYQLGNEAQHAFMIPMIQGLGGTVVLHDWVLFDLAVRAFPALERGGLAGLRRAYAEGGVQQALCWRRARQRGRSRAQGWFAMEGDGRWSAGRASLPVSHGSAVRMGLHVPAGRGWSVQQSGHVLATGKQVGDQTVEYELNSAGPAALEVTGAGPMGRDGRPLGVFIKSLEVRNGRTWSPVPLENLAAVGDYGMATERFELPFNHSVVRHADAFLVHSDLVGGKVLESRNAVTPIYRVHHGAEPRWREDPRADSRRRLGLDPTWEPCFLLASFGTLQPHKRPGVLLKALALVRERGHDVRLLCVGEQRPGEFDLPVALETHGLEDVVHATGWLAEDAAWDALHGADLCLNLRGPSTGGTSGGVCQALSMGRPVIISDLPEWSHLPDDCLRRVRAGALEVQELADHIEELCTNREQLQEMEKAARRVVEDELSWSHVAERYIELLKTYPRARASRRSLLVRFVHATAKQKGAAETAEP